MRNLDIKHWQMKKRNWKATHLRLSHKLNWWSEKWTLKFEWMQFIILIMKMKWIWYSIYSCHLIDNFHIQTHSFKQNTEWNGIYHMQNQQMNIYDWKKWEEKRNLHSKTTPTREVSNTFWIEAQDIGFLYQFKRYLKKILMSKGKN